MVLWLFPIATLAATISAAIGMAGGTILLVSMFYLGMDPKIAIPVHAAIQLISNNTRVLAYYKHVQIRPVVFLAVSAFPGMLIGRNLIDQLQSHHIKLLLGLGILYATWVPQFALARLPRAAAFGIAGFLGGLLGMVMGVVAPLLAVFFIRKDVAKNQLIATQALSQAYLHLLKIVGFSSLGFDFTTHLPLIVPVAIATIFGTFIGKWISGKFSERVFQFLFKIVLSLLALELVVTATSSIIRLEFDFRR